MEFRLDNGTDVVVRQDDQAETRRAWPRPSGRLSDETVRKRFLSPKPRLTGTELRYLTEIDYVDHWAEVAVLKNDPESIIGVARWIRDDRDPHAG